MSGERKFLLLFCLCAATVSANCAPQISSQPVISSTTSETKSDRSRDANQIEISNMRPLSSEENAKVDEELQTARQKAEVQENEKKAAGFGQIDFRNFAFPVNRGFGRNVLPIELKNGIYKNYDDRKTAGGETFELQDVRFADVDADGKKEAVVFVWVLGCGGSCDGGATLIYIYKARQNKPRLMWRLECGSLAYGGGLKEFTLNKGEMILELFNDTRIRGVEVEAADFDKYPNKFDAAQITRLILEFNGQTFVQKERTVFPFPEKTARNHRAEVKIE